MRNANATSTPLIRRGMTMAGLTAFLLCAAAPAIADDPVPARPAPPPLPVTGGQAQPSAWEEHRTPDGRTFLLRSRTVSAPVAAPPARVPAPAVAPAAVPRWTTGAGVVRRPAAPEAAPAVGGASTSALAERKEAQTKRLRGQLQATLMRIPTGLARDLPTRLAKKYVTAGTQRVHEQFSSQQRAYLTARKMLPGQWQDVFEKEVAKAKRTRLMQGWHARPTFDILTLRERAGDGSEESATSRGTADATKADAALDALSIFSLSRASVPKDKLPSLKGVFTTDKIGTSGMLSWGGSTASTTEIEDLQLGKDDPTSKALKRAQGTADFRIDIMGLLKIEAATTVSGVDRAEPNVDLDKAEAFRAFAPTAGGQGLMPDEFTLHVGSFPTPFGIQNMRERKDSYFLDAPLAHTRLLGKEGMMSDLGIGMSAHYKAEGLRFHFGTQNAANKNMGSFLSVATEASVFSARHGGRPFNAKASDDQFSQVVVYGRIQKDLPNLGRGAALLGPSTIGGSAVWGPNSTGKDGRTLMLGVDADIRGAGPNSAWAWQTEIYYREFRADAHFDAGPTPAPGDDVFLPSDTLTDLGIYTQYLRALTPRVGVGLRLGYVTGSGQELSDSLMPTLRSGSKWRSDRYRVSALVAFRPAHELRLRIEYSYDDSDQIGRGQHSVWMSMDADIGALTKALKKDE